MLWEKLCVKNAADSKGFLANLSRNLCAMKFRSDNQRELAQSFTEIYF